MSDEDRPQINAASTMLGELTKFIHEELVALPEVWQKIPEEKQGQIIERLQKKSKHIIEDMVKLISADGAVSAHATVDSVTFKDGAKITLKAKLFENPGVHDLAESHGDAVRIVLVDAKKFTGGDIPEPDPDQPGLLDDGCEDGEEDNHEEGSE